MASRKHFEAGKLVHIHPDGPFVVIRLGRKPENKKIEPQAHERAKRFAGFGTAGQEKPSLAAFRPFGCSPEMTAVGYLRKKAEGAHDLLEPGEDTASLLRGGLRDDGFKWRSGNPAVDFWIGMSNPVAEFFRRWVMLQKMGKKLARTFDKEPVLPVAVREACGQVAVGRIKNSRGGTEWRRGV